MTKRVFFEAFDEGKEHRVRAYCTGRRWGTYPSFRAYHGRRVGWYVETRFKWVDGFFRNGEQQGVWTAWNPDGTVKGQSRRSPWEVEVNESPPWWNGATDQTTPSMPAWMKDDEQWQRALDAQD